MLSVSGRGRFGCTGRARKCEWYAALTPSKPSAEKTETKAGAS